jgi:hypothetical protein
MHVRFGVAVREQVLQCHFYPCSFLFFHQPNLHYPCRTREFCGLKTRTDAGYLLNLFVDAWIYDNLCRGEKDAEKIRVRTWPHAWIYEHIVTEEMKSVV